MRSSTSTESEFEFTPETSVEPLTMLELISMINGARGPEAELGYPGLVDGPRDFNVYEGLTDPHELVHFVHVSSEFYPALETYFGQRALLWLQDRLNAPSPDQRSSELPLLENELEACGQLNAFKSRPQERGD